MNQNRQDSTTQGEVTQNVINIPSSVETSYSVETSRNPFLDHIHLELKLNSFLVELLVSFVEKKRDEPLQMVVYNLWSSLLCSCVIYRLLTGLILASVSLI
jgi:hypothetical protein